MRAATPIADPLRGDWNVATWRAAAPGLLRKMRDDEVLGRAAQMAFYFFLSACPVVLLLMTSLGLFLDAEGLVRNTLIERLSAVAPASTVRVLDRLLDHVDGRDAAPLVWGTVLALWASSSGMVATILGLNKAYAVAEQRPCWKRRLVGLALTVVLMLMTAFAMLLLAAGDPFAEAVAGRLALGPVALVAWQIGQWMLIFVAVLLAFDLLYHFGPHRSHAEWRWLRPGTLIAIAVWIAASLGLKVYAATIGSYSVAYGSLGAVIVVLLWFYLTSLAILSGAEINARLEASAR